MRRRPKPRCPLCGDKIGPDGKGALCGICTRRKWALDDNLGTPYVELFRQEPNQ